MRLRFVSWNIHSCVGTDGRHDPSRVADVLARLDADVIGLQEVDWRKPRVNGRDQLAYLAEALSMTPVAGPNFEDHLGHYGNGLLTRLQIASVTRLELANRGREPRGLIDATLETEDRGLRVLVTHLGLSRLERKRQVRRITEHLDQTPTPEGTLPVLLGDLNEWLPACFRRKAGLPRHFAFEHAPRTFPSRLPLYRLDRILTGPMPSGARLCDQKHAKSKLASDHLPVCIDIRVNG